ncbi:MAG: hypothetical protein WC796_03055 [Candidatus Pacearchaeota archaeon]|jgi:hypothetical protein
MTTKSAFWQALVITVIIFVIGFIFGYFIEVNRSNNTQSNLLSSQVNLLDEQLRTNVITNFNVSCNESITSTFNFANKIYSEAILLEKYDSSTKFTDNLFILHKQYDILRMMLWLESKELKKQCSSNFHTVVYIYEYNTEDVLISAKQAYFSRLTYDLRNNHPDEILLIPIAGNTGVESINLTLKSYNIKQLPVIIIDEKKIVSSDSVTLDALEKEIFASKTNSTK